VLDEAIMTSIILRKSVDELNEYTESDVIIVGAGPAGLTAAYYLAKAGFKTLVFERKISYGGGMNGGGSLFHKVVVEELEVEGLNVKEVVKDLDIPLEETEYEGIYVTDAVALTSSMARKAVEAGAKVLLGWHVEDLIYREINGKKKVVGAVALWSPIHVAKLHVDPIFFKSRALIDATGHGAEILKVADEKLGLNLNVSRESGAWAERAEVLVVKETGKVIDGLYAAGMAVASWKKLPRMGPAVSGMLLSGLKVARVVEGDLKS